MWRSTWRLARCGDMWRGRAAGRGDVWGGCGMRRGDARGRDMWRWRGNMWSRRNMRGRGRARRSRRVRRGSCRAAVPAAWLLRLRRARRCHGSADDEQSRDANIALEHGTTSRVVRRQI